MYPTVKRGFDIFLSVFLLLLLSPVFLILAFLVWINGDGAVFFRQTRIGLHGKEFFIWKFATMIRGSSEMKGGALTLAGDPRVTGIGRFLRSSKLNELPQLINVLKGEMSFVGPRPLIRKSYDQYPPSIRDSLQKMLPGITGIGSIIFRNEAFLLARSDQDPRLFYRDYILPYKGEVEHWYYRNRSFRTDLLILGLTFYALFVPATPDLIFKVFPTLPTRPFYLRKDFSLEVSALSKKARSS
jgi:lipopolysaccharide/colanic/teichoic acid biosynthesis glycosyltransferase